MCGTDSLLQLIGRGNKAVGLKNEKYVEKCQHNSYCSSGGDECRCHNDINNNMCYSCNRG